MKREAEEESSGQGDEPFDVTITRDVQGGTLGIAVDLWDGEVTVGAIATNGPTDREGTLVQGDIIRAVEGQECSTIEEVTTCVIKGGISLKLSIRRAGLCPSSSSRRSR